MKQESLDQLKEFNQNLEKFKNKEPIKKGTNKGVDDVCLSQSQDQTKKRLLDSMAVIYRKKIEELGVGKLTDQKIKKKLLILQEMKDSKILLDNSEKEFWKKYQSNEFEAVKDLSNANVELN